MSQTTQNEKDYIPRGKFKPEFMSKLPAFEGILKYAADPANELDIKFRGDYLNIYYLGGSLLKLSGRDSCDFDENYFYLPDKNGLRMTDIERLASKDYLKKKEGSAFLRTLSDKEIEEKRIEAIALLKDIKDKRKSLVNKLKKASGAEIGRVIDEMKRVMREWKKNLFDVGIRRGVVSERVVQHYISLFNKETESNSDFVVLDLEYALSENSGYCLKEFEKKNPTDKQPRIDIVAIEKATGQLFVMELKYGMKSVLGDAGAEDHLRDYNFSVGADDKWKLFWRDIDILFTEQKRRGLIKHTELNEAKPVFAFVFKSEKENDIDDFKRYLIIKHMENVPCVFLERESDYSHPKKEYHWLKIN